MMMEVCDHPSDEKSLAEYVRNVTASPFLVRTYMVVDDPATDEVISWNADGTTFIVWQTAEFARDLLPTLFKHSNFSSFIRQLNTYGFRKVATSRWEFSNEMFRKGEKDQLCEIRRRRACQNAAPKLSDHQHQISDEDQRSSSTSSSSEYTSLICENKRLRKENGVLNFELEITKKKCKQLLELVAVCEGDAEKEEENYEHEGPMLFGVRLMEVQRGLDHKKRKRVEVN
ncbi:heat stress transcription factor B-3-like isoform X2 [Primulina huaijiensis]|uniref:heat stress transcription factor B-3-like isoform X2 n=1 Tax=Primulina huaijiensis TaxID=1492673 RepID=UPI003CC72754